MSSPVEHPSTEAEPTFSLHFFLDAQGALAGAHTFGLAERGLPELLLPVTPADPASPWRLTVTEVHDLLQLWGRADEAELRSVEGDSFEVELPADDAQVEVSLGTTCTAAALKDAFALEALADDTELRVAAWSLTPGPSPRPLAEERVEMLGGAVNGLRLAAGSVPVDEASLDFSPTAPFGAATPMVEAISDAIAVMAPPQFAAWYGEWTEVTEGGYRPDVAMLTCETLAHRVGRADAWAAAGERADEIAKEALGVAGPSELLMETCALLFDEVGVDDDETKQMLLGRIAVMLHEQIRMLLLSTVVEDVAPAEIAVPPLQSWWSGVTMSA